MAQDNSKTSATAPAMTQIDCIDTVQARLSQSRGILAAISISYDDKSDDFALGARWMRDALDATCELLDQGFASAGKLTPGPERKDDGSR